MRTRLVGHVQMLGYRTSKQDVGHCRNVFISRRRCDKGVLPQGQPERYSRAAAMVAQVHQEMFGYCTNIGECEAVCPKDIKLKVIARMNRDFLKAAVTGRGAGS